MKAKELWVHFKRLYEPDANDRYWKFEATDLSTTWSYYDSCETHHVSNKQGVNAFMIAEKEYPLRAGTLEIMLAQSLRVREDTENVRELIQRIKYQNKRASQDLKGRR